MALVTEAEKIHPDLIRIRRQLHEFPELAFEEVRTAETIIAELKALGIPYDYGGKGGGVIGHLSAGRGGGPAVALRAEMDALPCQESTGLPFASRVDGVMHACGHDAHVAMVLGAARLLAASPPDGRVAFVFQPAEERGAGAREMIRAGALRGVSAIFGGHVTNQFPAGDIQVDRGPVTAQSDVFAVSITGRGGHGARPHEAIDAAVIAASYINAVQILVAREINPVHPAVITVGRVEAGTAGNVIAERALLEGTIRSTVPEVREHLHRGLRRMAAALEELHGARISVKILEGYPPVVNTSREAEISSEAAARVVGRERIRNQDFPSMGSEDFSYYLHEIPGCYVRLGSRPGDSPYIPLHSPSFDIDEDVLKVGAAYFDEVAREAIRRFSA